VPLKDSITLSLLDGKDYKDLSELSTGQRCTVVLPIVLRHVSRILVVDQPEDHIDNAFIADTLIRAVSERSPDGQIIFSTYNANIPVLGDAVFVIQMGSDGHRGYPLVRDDLHSHAVVNAISTVMEGDLMPSGEEQFSTATMTRDQALGLLKSGSPHERLRGARFFARNARGKDATQLRQAKAQETDSYVSQTLALAIKRTSPEADALPQAPVPQEDCDEPITRVRLDAVNWISGLLLHEIASPIGLIEEAATREIVDYPHSQVHARIKHLQTVSKVLSRSKTRVPAHK